MALNTEGSLNGAGEAPTANAGPDFTLEVGLQKTLSATASDYDSILWTCTSGQSPTIANATTLTPTITLNETGAHTFKFAATLSGVTTTDTLTATGVELTMLEIMEVLDYEFVPQGDMVAYKGRSNRKVMQFKPSSTTGLTVSGEFLNLEENEITKIELIAGEGKISTDNDSMEISGTKLLARLGDLAPGDRMNDLYIVFYIGEDEKGIVVTAKGTAGYDQLTFNN